MKLLSLLFLVMIFSTHAAETVPNLSHFSEPFLSQQMTGNSVQVLNSGIASFQKRLDLIKRASKTIEIEYFIYNTDQAGKLFSHALVDAAIRGVKVRILVDKSLPVFVLDEFYAKEFNKYGIEVRYYNDAIALQISTSQFRSHRKLFVIDDEIAITGGRNLADEYYDLRKN